MATTTKKTTKVVKAVKAETVKKPVKKVEAVKPVEVQKQTTVFKTAKYVNKNIQISPRKLRLLVDEVRKFSPVEALNRVKFINTKSARALTQALKNIIADAKNNFNLDTNSLKFDTIKADEALKIKRMDKSHGSRFARGLIQKRHSRLVIIVKGVQK
ncbi:MAG: uL22 family ribosomal protein [Candidatus Shapirobacteria bacterium]|nr:uL22 family ribosomal protein [Candidatus Shapirobacteria bacterium]